MKRWKIPAGLGITAIFLLCALIAHPWAEMPISDDYSYIRTAELLARTGHIIYNGWATAMIGWQLYAGAAMIKLLGMSFTAPRLATWIVACITVYLTQRTLVLFGLTERNANLTASVLTLSPVFFPLSFSFFSDIYGMFALISCFYACLRGLNSKTDLSAITWISTAALSNAVLGTCRQIAWLGILVVVPSSIWLLRRQRKVVTAGVLATLTGVVIVYLTMHWYAQQPYALTDHKLFDIHSLIASWRQVLIHESQAILETLFLLLPLLLPFMPSFRRATWRFWTLLLGISAIWTAGLMLKIVGLSTRVSMFTLPLLQDWFTLGGHFAMYDTPVVLTRRILIVLNVIFYVSLLCTLRYAARFLEDWRGRKSERAARLAEANDFSVEEVRSLSLRSWEQSVWLLLPFVAAYLLLLIPRASDNLYDRYALPLAFAGAVFLVKMWQDTHTRAVLPMPTIVAIVIVASFSIGSAHDLFASYRAKVAMVEQLEHYGFSDIEIDAGWDSSGWTELQHARAINDYRILNPPGGYMYRSLVADDCLSSTFAENYPHVQPKFGLRYKPKTADKVPEASASYRRWLAFGRNSRLYVIPCKL